MTRVEELARVLAAAAPDSWSDMPEYVSQPMALAALAWMAERVPHLESTEEGSVVIVITHERDTGTRLCATLGGRCAWEEPRVWVDHTTPPLKAPGAVTIRLEVDHDAIITSAYMYADAMLKERERA